MKYFIIDVDGVLATGQFFYSKEGKIMKVFGPDDNDGLSLLKPFLYQHCNLEFCDNKRKFEDNEMENSHMF